MVEPSRRLRVRKEADELRALVSERRSLLHRQQHHTRAIGQRAMQIVRELQQQEALPPPRPPATRGREPIPRPLSLIRDHGGAVPTGGGKSAIRSPHLRTPALSAQRRAPQSACSANGYAATGCANAFRRDSSAAGWFSSSEDDLPDDFPDDLPRHKLNQLGRGRTVAGAHHGRGSKSRSEFEDSNADSPSRSSPRAAAALERMHAAAERSAQLAAQREREAARHNTTAPYTPHPYTPHPYIPHPVIVYPYPSPNSPPPPPPPLPDFTHSPTPPLYIYNSFHSHTQL